MAGILTGSRFGVPAELEQAVIASSICVEVGADDFVIDGRTNRRPGPTFSNVFPQLSGQVLCDSRGGCA